jgi:hypothetical protein
MSEKDRLRQPRNRLKRLAVVDGKGEVVHALLEPKTDEAPCGSRARKRAGLQHVGDRPLALLGNHHLRRINRLILPLIRRNLKGLRHLIDALQYMSYHRLHANAARRHQLHGEFKMSL